MPEPLGVLGMVVVVEPLVDDLCFLDLLVVAPVAVLEPEFMGLLAEVSMPLAEAEGAVPMVDEDAGGLDAGGVIGEAFMEPDVDVEGAVDGAMGSSGAGCALAPPIAPPRAEAF